MSQVPESIRHYIDRYGRFCIDLTDGDRDGDEGIIFAHSGRAKAGDKPRISLMTSDGDEDHCWWVGLDREETKTLIRILLHLLTELPE